MNRSEQSAQNVVNLISVLRLKTKTAFYAHGRGKIKE